MWRLSVMQVCRLLSDPGADLVLAAIDAGIPVVPLPGPNAALTALIASGLDTREFTFFRRFYQRKSSHRKEFVGARGYI